MLGGAPGFVSRRATTSAARNGPRAAVESLQKANLIRTARRNAVGCGEQGNRGLCAVAFSVEGGTLRLALIRFPPPTSRSALRREGNIVRGDQGEVGEIQPCRPNQFSAAEKANEARPAQSQELRRAAPTVRRYRIAPMTMPWFFRKSPFSFAILDSCEEVSPSFAIGLAPSFC